MTLASLAASKKDSGRGGRLHVHTSIRQLRLAFRLNSSYNYTCFPNDILWSIKHPRSSLEYTQKGLRTYFRLLLVKLAWDALIFTCLCPGGCLSPRQGDTLRPCKRDGSRLLGPCKCHAHKVNRPQTSNV